MIHRNEPQDRGAEAAVEHFDDDIWERLAEGMELGSVASLGADTRPHGGHPGEDGAD